MMGFPAHGRFPVGGVPVEIGVPAAEFMEAIQERGIHYGGLFQLNIPCK